MGNALPALARAVAAPLVALALAAAPAAAQTSPPQPESAGPYVPTPWVIVDEIMKLAAPRPDDFVIDLGSGDGRLVIAAVQLHGARGGFGVDIDAALVKLANENAAKAGVADRVRFEVRDLFVTPVKDATLVTLYLLPTSVPKLESKLLAELRPGARVISHDYPFPGWPHEKVVRMDVQEKVAISGTPRTALYLYVVPARVGGTWDVTVDGHPPVQVTLVQKPEGVKGEARVRDRPVPLPAVKVAGESVDITLPAGAAGAGAVALKGKASGDAIVGSGWKAQRRS